MKGKLLVLTLTAVLSVTACYNIGPKTIPRDRFDYNAAISNSIDDRDFKSKSVFTFVMILFSLTESGDNANLPVITIPTG